MIKHVNSNYNRLIVINLDYIRQIRIHAYPVSIRMHAYLVRNIEIAYKILKTGTVIAVKEHIFIFYHAHILSNL